MSIPKLRFIKLSVPDAVDIIMYIDCWQSFLVHCGVPDPEIEMSYDQMTMIKGRLKARVDQVMSHE